MLTWVHFYICGDYSRYFRFFIYIYVKLLVAGSMSKKLLPVSLLVALCCVGVFSCRKANNSTVDATRNYFPIVFGKYVTYDVDSIYYYQSTCSKYEVKSQLKYAITDTFTNSKRQLSYIMNVSWRPYDGGVWIPASVITITPYTSPTGSGILYNQDNAQYIKLTFPVTDGYSWLGNKNVDVSNPVLSYLANWNYQYKNYHLSYNNGIVNFDNTVTVLENDESVNYPNFDSGVAAYRTYAKEVYAYNVGMIYKEWTHWTYLPSSPQCVEGYTVIMRAIEYN